MKLTQKCRVVMLGAPKSSIHHYRDEWMVAGIGNTVSEFNIHSNYAHHPQHLYFLSDRKIEIDDWYLDDRKQRRQCVVDDAEYWATRTSYKKIEATTDAYLGIAMIPKSFIEEYVKAEGKINEVEIEMEPFYYELVICTNKNECIVVMPLTEEYVSKVGVSITPEKTYTNAEVRALCHEAYHRAIYDFDIMNEDSSNFADWWDKQNLK